MKIKICGMKFPDNVQEIAGLAPDYLGFIFYNASKRYCADILTYESVAAVEFPVQKVGVFVNDSIKNIIHFAAEYELDVIQLHGDESVEFCEYLKLLDFKIIKAFGIGEAFDFTVLNEYESVCDYFLFDTKSKEYGGTGKHFDWNLLKQYDNSKPVFLSGGLEIQDVPTIHDLLKDVNIHALDFNSKLESDYGVKDIEKCRDVILSVRETSLRTK